MAPLRETKGSRKAKHAKKKWRVSREDQITQRIGFTPRRKARKEIVEGFHAKKKARKEIAEGFYAKTQIIVESMS